MLPAQGRSAVENAHNAETAPIASTDQRPNSKGQREGARGPNVRVGNEPATRSARQVDVTLELGRPWLSHKGGDFPAYVLQTSSCLEVKHAVLELISPASGPGIVPTIPIKKSSHVLGAEVPRLGLEPMKARPLDLESPEVVQVDFRR